MSFAARQIGPGFFGPSQINNGRGMGFGYLSSSVTTFPVGSVAPKHAYTSRGFKGFSVRGAVGVALTFDPDSGLTVVQVAVNTMPGGVDAGPDFFRYVHISQPFAPPDTEDVWLGWKPHEGTVQEGGLGVIVRNFVFGGNWNITTPPVLFDFTL